MISWFKNIVRSGCPKLYGVVRSVRDELRVRRVAFLYPFVARRLRRKVRRGDRLRVMFIVTEPAKWKCQSVYDVFDRSSNFEPVIGVSVPDIWQRKPLAELRKDYDRCVRFFEEKGLRIERIFDMERGIAHLPRAFGADIVFYPNAVFSVKGQRPVDVASYALTCYVPYYVPNYGDPVSDVLMFNHRVFNFYYLLNDDWVKFYREACGRRFYAGEMLGLGHPMLDGISFSDQVQEGKRCVIYAPHWTIESPATFSPYRYSTFLWNGREILAYAKAHPEFEWVFKPHPGLWNVLVDGGVMTEAERASYYEAWGSVGTAVTSGGYEEVFRKSFAMITDCGSFLTEYASTGKPIIHLISRDNTLVPMGPSKALYDTYYKVHDLSEMYKVFESVLEAGADPLRIKRQDAVRKAKLVGSGAAEAICKHLSLKMLVEG